MSFPGISLAAAEAEAGKIVAGIETEHDIFKALQMQYVEPKDRR